MRLLNWFFLTSECILWEIFEESQNHKNDMDVVAGWKPTAFFLLEFLYCYIPGIYTLFFIWCKCPGLSRKGKVYVE